MTRRLRQAKPKLNADLSALVALGAMTGVVLSNRFAFDSWLARLDISTFLLPWYIHLGERLRGFDLPGWNPYLFSGTPFAGDPQSGWMNLPAMIGFVISPDANGFKLMVALQVVIGCVAMYGLARVLGMRPFAAHVAATIYLTGPFLHWNTYCCAIFGQFGTWVPVMLLGVELSLRSHRWRDRWLWWLVGGFALSQIFASWLGQGALFALLLLSSYGIYRAFCRDLPGEHWRDRLAVASATGCAVVVLGAAFGAGGLWPRLEVNAVSNLAGGNYSALGAAGENNPPWTPARLVLQMLGGGHEWRESAIAGSVAVLALLAPVVARRHFAVPYFTGLLSVSLVLTQETTPLHQVFFLIPRFRTLHEHDPWRIVALAAPAPALLAAGTVESLLRRRLPNRLMPVVVAPLAIIVIAVASAECWGDIGWVPFLSAVVATVLLLLWRLPSGPTARATMSRAVPALLLATIMIAPAGLELMGSWLRWPADATWERHWRPPGWLRSAFRTEMSRHADTGAAGFLQAELRRSGPFRYVGYGVAENEVSEAPAYLSRRFEPGVQAILVNARPMLLGLFAIQGYNPIQLARYVEFIEALNGRHQNYHTANLLASGTDSPLLNLLDVRFVVIDRSLSPNRQDVRALTSHRRLVYRDDTVEIYETMPRPPHAWLVHDVRGASRQEALEQLVSGGIDPYRTALVEEPVSLPPASQVSRADLEFARIVTYEADGMTIEVTASAPGLLVLSEVYAPGWRSSVDGQPAHVIPVDGILRGTPVPAGTVTVELVYRPLSLSIGTAISAATMAIFLATGVVASWLRWVAPAAKMSGQPQAISDASPLGA